MPSYSKLPLSGSTHGRGIKVTTASPIDGSDTTIHTATSATADGLGDMITLFAANGDTVTRQLHLGWGGTSIPDDMIIVDVPCNSGLILVVADLLLRNSLVVVASASAVDVITLFGYVLRVA